MLCMNNLETDKLSLHIKNLNFIQSSTNGNKIYEASIFQVNKIYNLCEDFSNKNKLSEDFTIKFNKFDKKIYIVKYITFYTYRKLLTAFREVIYGDKIWNSKYKNIKGSDIVPKIFYSCPVVSNNGYFVYMIIMEKIIGRKIFYKYSFLNRIFSLFYNKNLLYKNIFTSIKNLWLLGYSHNDLHLGNILIANNYKKNKIIKFIDFETVQKIPCGNLLKFREELEKETDYIKISEIYINEVKPNILLMIYLSSKYFELYNIDYIQNSDEKFLLTLKNYFKI